jgi:diacylglycerol kinase (ATP)
MRITLIHNPKAGDEGPSGKRIESLIRRAGHEVVYYSSKEKHYVSALESPGDLVVVAGGDGTVRKVAMRLLGSGVPIATLPLGTANNISSALGVQGPLEEIIAGWDLDRRKIFSVGLVSCPSGKTQFIEGMGLGLFSTAMVLLKSIDEEHGIEFDDTDSKIHSDVSSIMGMVTNYQAHDLKITIDGEDFSGQYLLLEAMNINFIGPNLLLAPDADPSDGHLDFVFVSEGERNEFEDYLTRRLECKDSPAGITVRRGKKLEVQWQGEEIHVDDRIWTKRIARSGADTMPVEVSLQNHALEFLAPR